MTVKALRKEPGLNLESPWVVIGWISRIDAEGGHLFVDFPDNPGPPVVSASLVVLDEAQARKALADKTPVCIAFIQGDLTRPIVLGLIAARALATTAEPPVTEAQLPAGALNDLSLEGKKLELEGKEQLVLKCGEASIELRKDGRIVIRGVHLVSHAQGVNRIRGGAVQIN